MYGEQQSLFTYDKTKLIKSTATNNCGDLTVIFMTEGGFNLPDCFSDNGSSLTVSTENVESCGVYKLKYTAFYSGLPSVTVDSDVFTVNIVNPCIPPAQIGRAHV